MRTYNVALNSVANSSIMERSQNLFSCPPNSIINCTVSVHDVDFADDEYIHIYSSKVTVDTKGVVVVGAPLVCKLSEVVSLSLRNDGRGYKHLKKGDVVATIIRVNDLPEFSPPVADTSVDREISIDTEIKDDKV